MKITLFTNLVVCKTKLQEWQSVTLISDQIMEMDKDNVKALYFRGKAFKELGQFDKSLEALNRLIEVDPSHAEAKKLKELTNQAWRRE
jgi:tetratricopeptide (TPR) repeat protein